MTELDFLDRDGLAYEFAKEKFDDIAREMDISLYSRRGGRDDSEDIWTRFFRVSLETERLYGFRAMGCWDKEMLTIDLLVVVKDKPRFAHEFLGWTPDGV